MAKQPFPPCVSFPCDDRECCGQGKYKTTWPNLVGTGAQQAKTVITRDNPLVTVVYTYKGSIIDTDLCCNRVALLLDGNNRVIDEPMKGKDIDFTTYRLHAEQCSLGAPEVLKWAFVGVAQLSDVESGCQGRPADIERWHGESGALLVDQRRGDGLLESGALKVARCDLFSGAEEKVEDDDEVVSGVSRIVGSQRQEMRASLFPGVLTAAIVPPEPEPEPDPDPDPAAAALIPPDPAGAALVPPEPPAAAIHGYTKGIPV
ncbi:hypothetical protein BUALT_Bualt01G0038400 [Buddleja alternifolia]|uniref:Uncharacterized protein n=1 Tax=Buddleja alternifolia TaxID=168488 RepID=A0AAV6Y496_9LAMI|nr:hypothetical protein BUALT_Bualt01G0038400 [Buddleja alternifolia]